jgi:hypothetical protein
MAAAPDETVVLDALEAELRRQLNDLRIGNVDTDTIRILTQAALLRPARGGEVEGISTTRLFAAVVEVGGSSKEVGSYPAAIARAIDSDAELKQKYQETRQYFETDTVEGAVSRLHNRWFSANVQEILTSAAKNPDGLPLSSAIVRTMLTFRPLNNGLLYQRIPIEHLASAVAASRSPGGPGTLRDEVTAVLSALGVQATSIVRSRLCRAATYRLPGDAVELNQVALALLEGEPDDVPRNASSPSAMLLEAVKPAPAVSWVREATTTPVSLDTPPDPSNPLRLAPAVETLLRRAYDEQRRRFLNPSLGTKGLVACLLTLSPEDILGLEGLGFEGARERFRDIIRTRLVGQPEILEQWEAALEFQPQERPRLSNDQPVIAATRDRLGIENDAFAVANVAAGQATNLPLAFGIFGDWGAGKTFFMNLVRRRISNIVMSRAEKDGFEHAIVRIQFNAWHYAETNLWASLVNRIFEELDRWMTRGPAAADSPQAIPDASARAEADSILKRLSTSRQLTLEAATELVQRRREHSNAARKLAEAQQKLVAAQDAAARAPLTVWRTAVTAARNAITRNDELRQQLGTIEATLGIPCLLDDKAKLAGALEELKRSASAGHAALGALRGTVGSAGTVPLALVALVGTPAILFALSKAAVWLTGWSGLAEVGHGSEALGGLLTMAAVLTKSFAKRVRSLADQFASLEKTIDTEIANATASEQGEVAEGITKIAQSRTEVEKAKAVMQATGDQVATALRDYTEETGSRRILRFVRARAGASGYGKHLGLVSTIRKDFEQLEGLMLPNTDEDAIKQLEQARAHYELQVNSLIDAAGGDLDETEKIELADTAKSIDIKSVPAVMKFNRIVLYVDDLDRCDPDKVVEVLQAVNMLLSFRLFVVMVAVDARWLLRSLEARHKEFFGLTSGGEHEPFNRIKLATAADYLEKIFQIPYWVPPMTEDASKALVGDLIAVDKIRDESPREGKQTQERDQSPIQGRDDSREGGFGKLPDEDDQPQSLSPSQHELGLTTDEMDTLLRLSPFIGGSPRRARRFVNVYRVAKASLTPVEVRSLEKGEHQALATQLAISTGAPNAFSSWIDICKTAPVMLENQIANIWMGEDERGNITGALQIYRDITGGAADAEKRLIDQIGRASRFSFAVPHWASPTKTSLAPIEPAGVQGLALFPNSLAPSPAAPSSAMISRSMPSPAPQ